MSLLDGMRRLAADLRTTLETTANVQHRLTKGEMREDDLRRALGRHIPSRFSLGSGEIVNSAGQISLQQDLIVSDSLAGSPFLAAGGAGVFPVETVFTTLQVKSSISASDIPAVVDNLASVKRLVSEEPREASWAGGLIRTVRQATKPMTGVIAFSGPTDLSPLIDTWADHNGRRPIGERANLLYVLDRACIVWGDADDRLLIAPGPDVKLIEVMGPEGSILVLYALLTLHLQQYVPPALDVMAYVNTSGLDFKRSVRNYVKR